MSCHNPLLLAPDQVAPFLGQGDIREEAVEESVLGRVFATVPAYLDALPALPGVFQQILALIHDPISDMDSIVEAVETDATLTLHLMRTANSALYRGVAPVEDARGACVRLGLKEVAHVVWRVQVAGAFRARTGELASVMNELWNMSVAVGCYARGVAQLTAVRERESAFLAGLTHAVGQTLLVQMLAAEPSFAIQRLSQHEDRFRQLLERLGPHMGLIVLDHWRMPASLRASVYCQRMPLHAPTLASRQLAHSLALGIEAARLAGFVPAGDDELSAHCLRESCEALGLVPGNMPDFAESLRVDVESFVSAMAQV